MRKRNGWTTKALLGALVAGTSVPAMAQTLPGEPTTASDRPVAPSIEAPDTAGADRFSGSIGVDYASHFVSYGADVWGAGGKMFGSRSTFFVWGDFNVDVEPFTINFGVWSDLNDNDDSPIGGSIQEIDVYAGIAYTIDRFTLGATYQEWYYASDEERVLDLAVSFDDSDLLVDGFALNPSFVAHLRVDGNNGQEEAEAFVLGIEPSFEIVKSETYPVTLSIPASVAYFTDGFHGGDSGFGYAAVGATVGVPLAFIPAEYGAWEAAANVTYYYTEEDVIPGNAREDFFTGMLSLSMSF